MSSYFATAFSSLPCNWLVIDVSIHITVVTAALFGARRLYSSYSAEVQNFRVCVG